LGKFVGNFRAKDSAILNKMAGKSQTHVPESLSMDSWHATILDFGKKFTRRRDSQLVASILARTIFLEQFFTISKSPKCHRIGEWNFTKNSRTIRHENIQNSGIFALVYQVQTSQMTLFSISFQILMLFKTAMIIAGSLESHITFYGQMERLNMNGMAKGM
jgi:hypothetical protein